jgi:predicted nucleic acid-binding protein
MKRHAWTDTSFLYALFVKADKNHQKSKVIWEAIISRKIECVTSNLVTAELGTLFAYRFGHEIALQRMRLVYDSLLIKIVYSTPEIESKALVWWKRYSDQKFSVTDCVSFEFMKVFGIDNILTFDIDFAIAGFNIINNLKNL